MDNTGNVFYVSSTDYQDYHLTNFFIDVQKKDLGVISGLFILL